MEALKRDNAIWAQKPPDSVQINISAGHVTTSGQTQYGKSFYVKEALFNKYPKAIFYDLKHDPNHKDLRSKYATIKSLNKLIKFFKDGGTHCIYQPPYLDYKGAVEHFDTICKFIFTHGNIALFNDEAAATAKSGSIGHWYYVLMTQGLSRGCNVVNITQRPTSCNNVILSQSEYFVLFRHNIESDRHKLAGIVGEEVADQLKDLPKYYFIFVYPNGETVKGKL